MNASIVRWAAAAAAATLTLGTAAAGNDGSRHKLPEFRVVNLASLGGSENAGNSIDDRGLVAGFANLPDNYDHGVMTDLNELLPADYADHLYTATDINNDGQITGYAIKAGTEESVAVMLLPQARQRRDNSAATASLAREARSVQLPADARNRVLLRAGATEARLGK